MADPKLVATYYTLAGNVYPGVNDVSPFDFPRRAKAAAAAGYFGIGISGCDLAVNVERYGAKGIRTIVNDAGLQFLEIECLVDWFAEGENRASSDQMRKQWIETAADTGAQHFKVVGDLRKSGISIERMAEEFRSLCDQFAPFGAYVSIEIFPEANIADLRSGKALMDLAGATNGGLLIDIWHMTRPGIPYEEVAALPSKYIKHVEVDDAAAEMVGTLYDDSTFNRLLPGQGSFDVPAFLGAIAKTGYQGVYGVEILSETFRGLDPEEAARLSFDSTMSQFALLD